MRIALTSRDALLVVDVQVDFCPDGALPVPLGDKVVPALNEYVAAFGERGLPIVASRDWHPRDHCSFVARGGRWPAHCVQDTPGARFHELLALPRDAHVVSKADTRDQDAYSAFEGTDLTEWLRARGVRRVLVGGLATDYCVRASVLDAIATGFEAILLLDASRGVDVTPGAGERAIEEMLAAGAVAIEFRDIR